jgi:endonuclease/exonuclease/phosphatase (EEP) superfamily protein YafD
MKSVGWALRLLLDLAVLGLAATCCIAAVAAQGGRWNDRLDLLTHFAPVWLAGGVVGLGLVIFMRRAWPRVLATLLALAAVLSSTSLMWTDLTRLPAPPQVNPTAKTLKLIEFNAWERNAITQRVGEWLAREDPDVVVLIEPSALLVREIAARTKLHFFHGSGALIATRDDPLSEHVAWEVRGLPGAPTEFAWVELRGSKGHPFTVIGVHNGRPIPSRYAWGQDQKVAALLATQDRSSVILTGDFNSTQWSFRQRIADASFGVNRRDIALPTWPARLPFLGGVPFPFPFLAIDHVYAGSSWRTVNVKRGPWMGSDHYPIVAILAER